MTITPTDGDNSGSAIKCLYTQEVGPETTRMTIAMGVPGAEAAPENYDLAMTNGLMELYLVKCNEEEGGDDGSTGEGHCDFSRSAPE